MRWLLLLLIPAGCGDKEARAVGDSPSPVADSSALDSRAGESGTRDSQGARDTADGPVILITEVMADNAGALLDGDGDSSDWIELYNPGPEAVELEGWGLSDDPDDPFAWTLPEVSLVPGGFLVVFASGKGVFGPAGELHTTFALDRDGESVALTRPGGGLAHALTFPAQREDISYGLAQRVTATPLVADGGAVRIALDEQPGWDEVGFDDAGWVAGILPVGFDGVASDGDDADTAPENRALFQPTDQSSDGYGYTGQQAVDGELSSFSHTGDGDLSPWWSVDLEADLWITGLRLHNRQGCCPERLYNITVEVLGADDAVVYSSGPLNPVAEGDAPTDPGALLEAPMAEGVVGRSVRVSKQAVGGAGSSEWMSMAEVEVLATDGAPYSAWIATDLGEAMRGVSAAAWLRAPFAWGGAPPDRLTLAVDYDDGWVAALDGQPLASANAGDGVALAARDAGAVEVVALDPAWLGVGDHVLAVQGLNVHVDDDDFFLSLTLEASDVATGEVAWFDAPTPGAPNGEGFAGFVDLPEVDPPRGFYDAPLTARLTSESPGATLGYTRDGRAPAAGVGGAVEAPDADTPPAVDVAIDTTATLRVAAFAEGYADSPAATHTYLFLDHVIRQPAAPEGLPATWDGASQAAVSADYEMDPAVVDDPAYTEDLLAGLRDIATMSIVMDPDDLFGAEEGIYVHSLQRGSAWERAASVELILPDGSTGFQVDSGLRVHGYGWRYHSNTKKHALRLELSPDYGPAKLDYPLFPDAPIERFDSIVLRSQGSRGWQDFRDPEQAQYIRDAWARDTARDMGRVDGHAIFVHLYLNGLYWGLYNPVERPDAGFGEEYFGGSDEDYDAINRRTTTNEAIDGDLVAYDEMIALADAGLSTPEDYEAIQGYIDVEDLVDYMLIHQYTVNMDGPEISSHNNMRGIRRREEGAQFRFFVWDMEYSIWDADDDYNIDVDVPGSASHVYAALRENDAFRALYAERARAHLTGDGALTPANALARWEARAEEIQRAIVAESARWGDTDREPPYTRDVEWAAERERLTTQFFPHRAAILIEQLTAAGLY